MVTSAFGGSAYCRYKNCIKQSQSKCDGYCIAHYKLVNNIAPGKRGRKRSSPVPDVISSLPFVSCSSNSSASSAQKIDGNEVVKRATSFTVDSTDTSVGKSNKLDKKGICPKCNGDVTSPPFWNCNDGNCRLEEHNNIIVTCSLKGCSAPKYHVSTSFF